MGHPVEHKNTAAPWWTTVSLNMVWSCIAGGSLPPVPDMPMFPLSGDIRHGISAPLAFKPIGKIIGCVAVSPQSDDSQNAIVKRKLRHGSAYHVV